MQLLDVGTRSDHGGEKMDAIISDYMSKLEQSLKKIIPDTYSTFPKLERGDPYHFDRWDSDINGDLCLYYWFWNKNQTKKNKKRVVISEMEELIRNSLKKGHITRKDFQNYCPISKSEGSCGFAVVGRLLEYLDIAKYLGRIGFGITDEKVAKSLLENDEAP
jgi:hypothetical protein